MHTGVLRTPVLVLEYGVLLHHTPVLVRIIAELEYELNTVPHVQLSDIMNEDRTVRTF